MNVRFGFFVGVGIMVLLESGCEQKSVGPATFRGAVDKSDIVGKGVVDQNDQVAVDVFIDATISMKGFSTVAGVTTTVMDLFLEDLESAVLTSWKSSDLKYFKFGTMVREVLRPEFLQAKETGFYNEPGIREKTNIDSVIDRTDPKRVSIVITDLFQTDGDASLIVRRIKERCFRRGIQLGIVGIPGDYEGVVYDTKVPPYTYKSSPNQPETYRPFYMLVFGDEANIAHLFDTFKSRPYLRSGGMIVISQFVVSDFAVKLDKEKGDRAISMLQVRDVTTPYRFSASLNDRNAEVKLSVAVSYQARPWAPEVNTDQLKLEVLRQNISTGKVKDTSVTLSTDIKIAQGTGQPNSFRGTLVYKVSNPGRNQSYQCKLYAPAIDGFNLPKWVSAFSSSDPRPDTDANKTINLDRFVMDLLKTNATIHTVNIGKFYLDIRNTK